MDYKVFISPQALGDFECFVMAHAMDHDPETAARSANQLFDEAFSLRQRPERGRPVPQFRRPALREIYHRTSRIVYRIIAIERAVEIVRVLLRDEALRVPNPPRVPRIWLS